MRETMKTFPLVFFLLGLTSTTLMAQKQTGTQSPLVVRQELAARAQMTPPTKPNHVLFDFRVNQTSKPSIIPLATQRRVLRKSFSEIPERREQV